jgi:hypothetical protein
MTLKNLPRLNLFFVTPRIVSKSMQSQPSQPRSPLNGVDQAEEQQVAEAIELLKTIRSTQPSTQAEVNERLEAARSIIAILNATSFMTLPDRYDDQIFIITELQNLAYCEVDGGGDQDLAQWCIRMYLQVISQSRDDCVEALTGKTLPLYS